MTIAAAMLVASLQVPAGVPAGVLVERVSCPSDPSQSYTLYLPSTYSTNRKWPLLFIFDPRGRGTQAAEIFRDAAERFGWIIASSNNTSSDGEWEPNRRALAAMWPDVRRAYAVDERRVYATGFSGGASVAWILAETSGGVAGVIAVGAPNRPDAKLPPNSVAWFGAAGRADFNFLEAKRIDERMARAGLARRLEFFDGSHRWIPSALAIRALAWLEMRAMKDGRRSRDPALARVLIDEELEYRALLRSRRFSTDARRVYASVAADYEGLEDVSAAVARRGDLDKDERFKAAQREEQRIDARERVTLNEIATALRGLFEPELPLSAQLLAALRVNPLRKAAQGKGYGAASAVRILEQLFVQTSFYVPRDFERQKQYDRAALALEIATSIHPERPGPWLELAAHRARLNQTSRALSALERAVEAGYRDAGALEADPRFSAIRGLPALQNLLQKMKTP